MKCKECGSIFYVDLDHFQGIIEQNCPLCGYPHVDRSKKIREYFSKEFKKLREGKEGRDA